MSSTNNKTPYHLDGPNIFHSIMVPNALQPNILYECHNALGHNGST